MGIIGIILEFINMVEILFSCVEVANPKPKPLINLNYLSFEIRRELGKDAPCHLTFFLS
jgi:hypothetical protein